MPRVLDTERVLPSILSDVRTARADVRQLIFRNPSVSVIIDTLNQAENTADVLDGWLPKSNLSSFRTRGWRSFVLERLGQASRDQAIALEVNWMEIGAIRRKTIVRRGKRG